MLNKIEGIERNRGSSKTGWMDCIEREETGMVNWRRMELESNG
jgi:hypothetical protein